jgi:hypothetical protein
MWSARLCSAVAAAAMLAVPALAQEPTSWERGEEGEVMFADLQVDRFGRFTLFCRITSTGPMAGLALKTPSFQNLIRNEQSYDLTLVIDGARDSVHMEARDIELWFEAKDLNQQTQMARLFTSLEKAQQISFAVSTLGWRDSRRIANSETLAGLMDKCL